MLDCQMLKASNGLLPNHQIEDDKKIGKKCQQIYYPFYKHCKAFLLCNLSQFPNLIIAINAAFFNKFELLMSTACKCLNYQPS